jgi:hypothetical protein
VVCALIGLTTLSRTALSAPDEKAPAADEDAEQSAEKKTEGATDEAEAESSDAVTTSEEAEVAAKREASAEAPIGTPQAEDEGKARNAGLGIERLPPSAYPEPRTRGIYGGSLWLTFHGLQWPYVPEAVEGPGVVLGVSGSIWVDGGYQRTEINRPSVDSTKREVVQGRAVIRFTPTYTAGDTFVQAQAELVANSDMTRSRQDAPDTDDLWVRAGVWNVADVQVGRYEAWELYHYGMGLDINTIEREGANDGFRTVRVYGVNYIYDRQPTALYAAGHFYIKDFLRFELLGEYGQEAVNNVLGIRPSAILDLGVLKVKGGVEYKSGKEIRDGNPAKRLQRGGGGTVQLVLDPRFEAGVSGAYGLVDGTTAQGIDDLGGSVTQYSVGGFANVRLVGDLIFGAGAHYTHEENLQFDDIKQTYGNFAHLQTFAAVQYIVAKQLFIKLVGAFAEMGVDETGPTSTPYYYNDMYSGRLRLMYLF